MFPRGDVTGKSLAYTRVDFFNAQGQLAAYGRAFEFILSSSPAGPGERLADGSELGAASLLLHCRSHEVRWQVYRPQGERREFTCPVRPGAS